MLAILPSKPVELSRRFDKGLELIRFKERARLARDLQTASSATSWVAPRRALSLVEERFARVVQDLSEQLEELVDALVAQRPSCLAGGLAERGAGGTCCTDRLALLQLVSLETLDEGRSISLGLYAAKNGSR